MNSNSPESTRFEELDYRESDGIEVSLLWSRQDNNLSVLVVDCRRGEMFELSVAAGEALEVFNHPFAYAAKRRITTMAASVAVGA